jgi:hypothetical protein
VNAYVHSELTRAWAAEEGFSAGEADVIARANVGVDRVFSGHRWRYKGYHFGWLGARRKARRFLARAVETGDLTLLGMALHCEQDALSHGHLGHLFHYPGIDIWSARSPRVRRALEARSRAMLREFKTVVRGDVSVDS